MRSIEEKKQELKKRLKDALRIIRLYEAMPKTGAVQVITHQLLRSGTSPGAHYREACRAKSDADFISKVEGVLQELDESDYGWNCWLTAAMKLKQNSNRSETKPMNSSPSLSVSSPKRKPGRRDESRGTWLFIPHPSSLIPPPSSLIPHPSSLRPHPFALIPP